MTLELLRNMRRDSYIGLHRRQTNGAPQSATLSILKLSCNEAQLRRLTLPAFLGHVVASDEVEWHPQAATDFSGCRRGPQREASCLQCRPRRHFWIFQILHVAVTMG